MFSSKSELNLLNRVKNGFSLHANSDGIELTMHKELIPPYLIHYTCLHQQHHFTLSWALDKKVYIGCIEM